ncbi:Coniferyl aldehyde dehydrogenase [Roseovarius sp. THAF27]|uniref:coniferyl aldehyde dehydrogenase n=1 Tax=Roseovarius sp. THAF27 TaxID=2587850 RepID=UPI001268D33F|nr:coniferyl aldehyde dehydrogenase [Roseovarius sp. THAF27]QFT79926.1 Coniferyl aldehyde dehydrogenase [Roseovarius sp. THAF27]
MENTLALMRDAALAERIPDAAVRRRRLDALRNMVKKNRAEIARAIDTDFGGRPAHETEILEIVPLLGAIRHARSHVARWMRDERRPPSLAFRGGRAWVRHEPLGVVGIVSPWNFPLYLCLGPLVDALAAGNRAMIKPSELTPRFSELLEELVRKTFESDEVAVIMGDVDVARAFTALPFDHLVFTGSTTVGRHVMRAAAENLTPVTLELGGKSPAIVTEGYSLHAAAQAIAQGKFLNAGQICIAPDYALVPAGQEEALARAVLAAAEGSYPAASAARDYASIITERHRSRLEDAVAEAEKAGARVLSAQGNWGGRMPPTVVIGAPEQGVLMTEEIFGPVLPIVPYRNLEDALTIVNRRDRPLALYAFAKDRKTQRRILDRVISGGVTLNGTIAHIAQENLPFGGVGASGMGAYHGRDGFRRLSHARSVFRPGPVDAFALLRPPFGRFAEFAIRTFGR